jgi:hypothetical protein
MNEVVEGEVGELARYRRRLPRRYDIHDSPLWTGGHSLWGRIVTDPREVALIAARVAWYARPWWRRTTRGGAS